MKFIILFVLYASVCFSDVNLAEREAAMKQTIEKTRTPESKSNYITFLLSQNRIPEAETWLSNLKTANPEYKENASLEELVQKIKSEPDLAKRKNLLIQHAFSAIKEEGQKLDQTIKSLEKLTQQPGAVDGIAPNTSTAKSQTLKDKLKKDFDLDKLLPLQIKPSDPEFEADQVAYEYLKTKDYEKAEGSLRTQLKTNAYSPLLISRLVEILITTNKEIQAHKVVRAALSAHPNEIQLMIMNKYLPLIARAKKEEKNNLNLEMRLMLSELAMIQLGKKTENIAPTNK